jgi:L-fuconolactonase
MRIDAHQHFWKFDAVRDSWIRNDMRVIRKDFLPADLMPLLEQNVFEGSWQYKRVNRKRKQIFKYN